MSTTPVRLQKFIADCGITSRRKAEEFIIQGRVQVNGERITQLGTKVDPSMDAVSVDGELLESRKVERLYLVMNKPRGIMTTLHDPEGRKTIIDLIPEVTERVYPVGRLDYLSEGLLILTNDGETANKIIHPSSSINKVYEVKVFGAVTELILKNLRKGVHTEVGFLKPKAVRVIKQLENKTWLEFRLEDGKNREIRRLCEACDLTVDKLKRIAIGGLAVEGIKPGGYRFVTKKQLMNMIGLSEDGMVDPNAEYYSHKKSVNLKVKGVQGCTPANDKAFVKFRKGEYFKTIKELEERKIQEKQKQKEEYLKKREELMKKRRARSKKKLDKRNEKEKSVHAIIL